MTAFSGPGGPLVSVILPARRPREDQFHQAIESVLSQTYRNLELILVDDGIGPIPAATAQDSRVRLVPNRGHGLVDALNTGLAMARGSLAARMDSDDICHPQRLELQVEAIMGQGMDIAGTGVEIFGQSGRGSGYALYQDWINSLTDPERIRREIFVESPLAHPSVMMKMTAARALGGYRDMGWPEDYDLWLRAMEAGYVIGKIPRILLRWRDGAGRLSRTDPRYSKDNFIRLKAHFLARTALKGKNALIWGAGKTGGMLARRLKQEGVQVRAFIDISPRKIGGAKAERPVFAPERAMDRHADELIIGAVCARGARELIRARLNAFGKVEGLDYLMAS